MSSTSSKASVWKLLALLVMTSSLGGCLHLQTIPTGATDSAAQADRAVTAGVCSVWKPVTYLSTTDEQTKTEIRANNAARDAYCG